MNSFPVGKFLIALGAVIVGAGILFLIAPKLPWLGRLPGDIRIERGNFAFYVPLMTSLIVSAIVSVILWVLKRFLP